jgi:hypothetical protein
VPALPVVTVCDRGCRRWPDVPRRAGLPVEEEVCYPEVAEALIGDLALVAWQRPYRVATAAAACTWREALGPVPLERLRDRVLAGGRRRAPQPRLPRRDGRGPGGELDRRVAGPGAGHPGEPGGVRVGRHRR